jgi:hypothetical protein
MKSEVYKRSVDTRDELLADIFDVAIRMKKREDQPKRTTRDLRARVAKYVKVDGGIFRKCIVRCKKIFLCNKFVI